MEPSLLVTIHKHPYHPPEPTFSFRVKIGLSKYVVCFFIGEEEEREE